jgi:threonine/homoserine/homoserine lactone efflux protein
MELIIFLLMVGFISLSGVLMPGPVFAAAVVKGVKDKHAGAWIALGHLMIEIPLILIIAAGFYFIFTYSWVQIGIGVLGGALLLFMGIRMIQIRGEVDVVESAFPTHSMMAGIITTVSNPYFILWWATIGAALIISALAFGWIGIIFFIIVHESCDLAWDYFVSYSVNKSRKFWTEKVYAYVFGGCGVLLVVFGLYFIIGVWI